MADWEQVQAIAASLQAMALFVAGCWAYIRFRKERTHTPHIEFRIHCNFYGPEGTYYIAEFLVKIRNKGVVQQTFDEITVRVRGISHNSELKLWKKHKPRLSFPLELIKECKNRFDVIPEEYKPYYVEPGCEEIITYVTKIPKDWKYVLAHARYKYKHKRQPKRDRTTERVLQVNVSPNYSNSTTFGNVQKSGTQLSPTCQ